MSSPFPKSSSAPGEGRIVAALLPSGAPGLQALTYQYPLKLLSPSRPSESKSVLVFLLSYGGGLVGGDSVSVSVEVQENTRLSLVTQGHTKIFASRTPDIVTRQVMQVRIGSKAALCLLPDPVQPFESSVYEQTQIFRLAQDASLCCLDWVTQGRTARGENWSFVRWVGRNEIWTLGDAQQAKERLLVRDAVVLDGRQEQPQLKVLSDTMHGMGIFGTLILRGPLMQSLGEFFLAEFDALPRLGARDFGGDDERSETTASPVEKWRLGRQKMEKENKVLWSAAKVRGCVVVKFGAPAVEDGRLWLGSMLDQEGSVSETFGDQALMCVRTSQTAIPFAENISTRSIVARGHATSLPPGIASLRDHINVMIPERPPLMEISETNATGSPAPPATARRSGRVTKAPEKFAPDALAAAKRKRGTDGDEEDAENASLSAEDDGDGDGEDADDTGDDEGPARARKRSSQSGKGKKPAAKKPKINGDAPSSANHAARLPTRPKKGVRIAVSRREGDGLYADIFASGDDSEKVATEWYHKFQEDDAGAVTDLVNCILLSAGCDQLVTEDDIQDPENASNRLADLQNVYTEEGITDYPLMSRAKSTRPFRDLLVGFFKTLVNVIHETDVLYKDDTLMENIARWVVSMSSSTLRPFRHTATTVALAMETALTEVAKKLDDRITKLTQQVEAEQKRKGKNKERLASFQRSLNDANNSRSICGTHLKDFFETVFVHRYRDTDAMIRTEAAEALGTWVWQLPTVFMEPEYLRYLGWQLSDITPQTRQEILKQLSRIFKRDAEKLGHFIDRFRPRLVEMATMDIDVAVRVAAINVMGTLKSTGMLEPDEIDSIGKLIFDSDLRVRKAVIDFFVDCVRDSIEGKTEDIGGSEVVEELFGEDDPDDYFSPRQAWLNIKCLAENLAAYDADLAAEQQTEPPRGLDIAVEMVQPVAPESRISLASQVLYEKVEQVRNWEMLAGYLLYDHTASAKTKSRSKKASNEVAIRNAVAPEGQEETILLEVLASAVKLSLVRTTDGDRFRRKPRPDGGDNPEDTAIHLAAAIPPLLRKFGGDPSTAVTVLQLVRALDVDVFQQLRQDSSTYTRLLDEICMQFNRHVDRGVLSEATAALLHARKYDELEETTDSKISVLWEDIINKLRHFDKTCELGQRLNIDAPSVSELGNVLVKMSKLASIADCVDMLEARGQSQESDAPAIEILVRIVHRGQLDVEDVELDDVEDEAISFAVRTCHFYFMWKVRAINGLIRADTDIPGVAIEHLKTLLQTYQHNLINTLSSRGTNDELRLFATGGLCDVHYLFASVRETIKQKPGAAQKYAALMPLLQPIAPGLVDSELLEMYDSVERAYAKKAKKTLNEPAEDEDPLDDDALSDDEDDADLTIDERKGRELKAEKALCELAGRLVMTILAKMVDCEGPTAGKLRKRMLRNRNKLGNNPKEILGYLDEDKIHQRLDEARAKRSGAPKKKVQKTKGKTSAAPGSKKPVSAETVEDGDSDEDMQNPFADEPEEGSREDLRRRGLLDEEIIDDDPIGDGDGDGAGNEHLDDESILGD
ncbi:hypothetical protein GQ53DRAFT_765468 [Thozetella sp. PMI_491]|nr:hypothetical protein GQ53DRAFT_765468 [Thozetella sp. PMI_491]